MRTYKVNTYNDKVSYKVTLDDTGVLGVDGLPKDAIDDLTFSVNRHMTKNKMSAVNALARAVGPYSYVVDDDVESVSD